MLDPRSLFCVFLSLHAWAFCSAEPNTRLFDTALSNQLRIGASIHNVPAFKQLKYEQYGELVYLVNAQKQVAIIDFCCGTIGRPIQRINVVHQQSIKPGRALNFIQNMPFVTNNHVQLGMLKADVLRVLGLPDHQRLVAGVSVVEYVIQSPKFKLLVDENMPEYFAEYRFDKHLKLVGMEFGFVLP